MKAGLTQKSKVSQKQKTKPFYIYAAWTLGIASVASALVFIGLNLGKFENALAGSAFTSTTTGGNWATGSTWVGGTAPGNWSNNTVTLNANVNLTNSTNAINGFNLITLNNGKSFVSGSSSSNNNLSMQDVRFNVASGSMTIYGNLTLSDMDLTLSNGSLNVTGTLNLNYGTTLTIASGASLTATNLSISNNNDAVLINNGTVTINGNISQGGVVNNNAGGSMEVGGNLTSTGSGNSVFTNAGNLYITNNLTLPSSGKLYNNPGGKILVGNNLNVSSNQNLITGTNVVAPPYADLVIQKNLVSSNSGDVVFNRNSRTAIFGNVTDSGNGGTLFTINNGGEVYIDGNLTYSGGGNSITNNNSNNPYGLYINGIVSNTGGGSSTTTNQASKAVMLSSNPSFYNWVALQQGSPLPITLLFFKVNEVSDKGIALNWATASEENFNKFSIERSLDGKNFTAIGEIQGAGESKNVLNYSYQDDNAFTGLNYYRLKSIDKDEKFEYSTVVSADYEGKSSVVFYPNPSNGEHINYNLNFSPADDDEIAVIDLSGSEIIRQSISESNGQIIFNTTLKPGAYIVKYTSSTYKSIQRMVVR